jgi:hypothetical protein
LAAVQRADHVAPRRVRGEHVGLHAPAAREQPGAQPEVGLELLDEGGLAHARLARDHHHARVPARRFVEQAPEDAHLARAAHEPLHLRRHRRGRDVGARGGARDPVAAGALHLVEGAVGRREEGVGAVAVPGKLAMPTLTVIGTAPGRSRSAKTCLRTATQTRSATSCAPTGAVSASSATNSSPA